MFHRVDLTNADVQYDIVVAVSELSGGVLDLTLSFWDSIIEEQDARQALDGLKTVLSTMGRDDIVTCADMVRTLV